MNKEVEYLKEHLYEIYKYKKSMKDLTYDMDIEHLLRTCKALDYSQKEIERLNNIINKVYEYLDKKKDVPEWWDTDFMICMNMLKGGTGYLKDILGSDKE